MLGSRPGETIEKVSLGKQKGAKGTKETNTKTRHE